MFEPLSFLDVSATLASLPNREEAHLRTAIGRAYYALHLNTRATLAEAGLYTPRADAGDHGGVIQALRDHRRIGAAVALSKLRSLREVADYRLDIQVDQSACDETLKLARDLVDLLSPDWR